LLWAGTHADPIGAMDLKLSDKVALVTGGSRGLGRAICLQLAREGARVAINYYRHQQAASELADLLRTTHSAPCLLVPGDVSQAGDVPRMFDQCEAELGPPDVLINNAGIWPTALVKDIEEADWDRSLEVNLKGAFLTCREAVRRWLALGRAGRIVNVSSAVAFLGSTTGHAHYAAAKAGLVSLTVSLAREVAPQGIAVNAVAPGMMQTDMAREALKRGQDHYLGRIPLRRIGDPAEVADVVVFLASERAGYMTGATVDVSGGMLMR
jgi:3-oxoacyl-[acyl-carrier protein] reductase